MNTRQVCNVSYHNAQGRTEDEALDIAVRYLEELSHGQVVKTVRAVEHNALLRQRLRQILHRLSLFNTTTTVMQCIQETYTPAVTGGDMSTQHNEARYRATRRGRVRGESDGDNNDDSEEAVHEEQHQCSNSDRLREKPPHLPCQCLQDPRELHPSPLAVRP